MFDIGFPELLVASVVALLVLGPERLPEALRTLGLWIGRAKRSMSSTMADIEREVGLDEIRVQLRNEGVSEEMSRLQKDIHQLQKAPAVAPITSAAAPLEGAAKKERPAPEAAPALASSGSDSGG